MDNDILIDNEGGEEIAGEGEREREKDNQSTRERGKVMSG